MRKRYEAHKAKLQKLKDLEAKEAAEKEMAEKQKLEGSSIKDITNIAKETFKDPETGKPDPLIEKIDKYAKYAPLVMKFIEGFKDQAMFNQQSAVKNDAPQPPNGWLHMTGLQRLGRKYTDPMWYAAGEAYESYLITGTVNPQVNIHHVDPTYGMPRDRSTEPRNLKDLSKKYPEPPLINQTQQSDQLAKDYEQNNNHNENVQESSSDGDRGDKQGSIDVPVDPTPSANQELLNELQADNARYLKLGIDYINSLSIEVFKNYIDNIDVLVEKGKPFLFLIPIHVNGMIQATPKEELKEIFKENCKEKYEFLEKENKVDKLLDLFEKIKQELSGTKVI